MSHGTPAPGFVMVALALTTAGAVWMGSYNAVMIDGTFLHPFSVWVWLIAVAGALAALWYAQAVAKTSHASQRRALMTVGFMALIGVHIHVLLLSGLSPFFFLESVKDAGFALLVIPIYGIIGWSFAGWTRTPAAFPLVAALVLLPYGLVTGCATSVAQAELVAESRLVPRLLATRFRELFLAPDDACNTLLVNAIAALAAGEAAVFSYLRRYRNAPAAPVKVAPIIAVCVAWAYGAWGWLDAAPPEVAGARSGVKQAFAAMQRAACAADVPAFFDHVNVKALEEEMASRVKRRGSADEARALAVDLFGPIMFQSMMRDWEKDILRGGHGDFCRASAISVDGNGWMAFQMPNQVTKHAKFERDATGWSMVSIE